MVDVAEYRDYLNLMTTTNNEISDDQISQLRDAAGEAGDHAQVQS